MINPHSGQLDLQRHRLVALETRWLQWWSKECGRSAWIPEFSEGSSRRKTQGDPGSGQRYVPSAMPPGLSNRYPIP